MKSKEEKRQDKPLTLKDYMKLNKGLEDVTDIQLKLLEYCKGKCSNIEEAKLNNDVIKNFMAFHKYRFTNPAAYAMIFAGMSVEEKKELRQMLDLIKKGE